MKVKYEVVLNTASQTRVIIFKCAWWRRRDKGGWVDEGEGKEGEGGRAVQRGDPEGNLRAVERMIIRRGEPRATLTFG